MAFSFPISLDIGGRRCVVVGGGAVAEQKARSLLDAGAAVCVIAPSFTPGLEELARRAHGARDAAQSGATPRLELVPRPYGPGDLEGAFLAVAATDDSEVNARVFEEAGRLKVLMNAVDDVEHCTFAFPSILRRGDLTVAISTGGKAPALAKRMRRTLSAELGPEYGVLVDLLAEVRAELMPRSVEFEEWARRWEHALAQDLPGLVRQGHVEEVKALVRACLAGERSAAQSVMQEGVAASPNPPNPADLDLGGFAAPGEHSAVAKGAATPPNPPVAPDPGLAPGGPEEGAAGSGSCGSGPSGHHAWMDGWELDEWEEREQKGGSVSIVGAGPGDPDLITVRGRRALDGADVVVHDRLVHPSLLEGKRAIFAGKEAGGRTTSQAAINELLVRLAREGLRVVRLKGGDPFVFGRGAEEAEALARAGIAFEIVPAPTSAIAVPAYAGIPVTDRRYASSVAFVTGHSAAQPRAVDWPALASAVDTIVILMGIRRLPEIAAELIVGGLDPQTPAAAIERGTLDDQRVVTAELRDLAEAAHRIGISSPAVVVIGEVVALRDRIAWFRSRTRDGSFPTAIS
jgi:uroporphyrin-III C-methyltransferase